MKLKLQRQLQGHYLTDGTNISVKPTSQQCSLEVEKLKKSKIEKVLKELANKYLKAMKVIFCVYQSNFWASSDICHSYLHDKVLKIQ